MGFWSKLGQTALRAAPYIAAPFTGGASLSMAGTANNLAGQWANKDAQKKYEQTGIAPSQSKFDQISNMAGNIGAMAGGMGAFNKVGGGGYGKDFTGPKQPGGGLFGANNFNRGGMFGGGGFGMNNGGMTPPYFGGGNQGMDWASMIGQGMNMFGNRGGGQQSQPQYQNQGQGPMGPSNQAYGQMSNRTPNLEDYFRQGSQEGLYDSGRQPYPESIYGGLGGYRRFGNQPYRGGYGGGGQRRGGGGRAIPRQGPLQDFMRQNEQRMRQPYIMN